MILNGTHVGNELNGAAWTLASRARCVAAGRDTPTRCVLDPPVTLPPGTHGIALVANGLAHAYANGLGGGIPLVYSNTELTLTAGAAQNQPFGGSLFVRRVVNCSIYHGGEVFASSTAYGSGCIESRASWYEQFAAGGTVDLSGASYRVTFHASGSTVTRSAASMFTHTVAGFALADDATTGPQALGFGLAYPGGTTTAINICSNGFIWLDASQTITAPSPSATELLARAPRLAPYWMDLSPDGSTNVANVYGERSAGRYVCTWLGVPEQGQSNANTFQVQIDASGYDVLYGTVDNVTHTALVGATPGNGAGDPGGRDLTAAIPFSTGAEIAPLTLGASNRPVIGTNITLDAGHVPATAAGAVVLLGGIRVNPGIDLTFLGMATCSLHVALPWVELPMTIIGSRASSAAVTVPGPPGAELHCQSFVLAPGTTSLGVIASNGLTLRLATD